MCELNTNTKQWNYQSSQSQCNRSNCCVIARNNDNIKRYFHLYVNINPLQRKMQIACPHTNFETLHSTPNHTVSDPVHLTLIFYTQSCLQFRIPHTLQFSSPRFYQLGFITPSRVSRVMSNSNSYLIYFRLVQTPKNIYYNVKSIRLACMNCLYKICVDLDYCI